MEVILSEFVAFTLSIVILVLSSTVSAALAITVGAGAGGAPMIAVFPPWWDRTDTLSATLSTEAAFVDTSRFAWMVVVAAEDGARQSLRRSGAVMFLNVRGAALCAASPEGA